MKQASVVASLVCFLINALLLNFATIRPCNGSKANTIMYEILSDHLKRFIFTDCQSTETANINCKCEDLGRDCENNDTKTCENCRCLKRSDKYRIFYIKKRNRAVCLSTSNLLKAAGFGEAFLVYNPPGNVSVTINSTDLYAYSYPPYYYPNDQLQMWVWTPGDLLMNVGTLKCLQVEGKVKLYRIIFVSRCDTSIDEQKWHCNEKLWFGISSQKDSARLTHALRYQRGKPSLLARTVTIINIWNLWTIYPKTNKTVCAARSHEGYFFLNRTKAIRISQIDLLPKCPKSGCLRRVYNSLNARNLTSCQILWEESSWLDVDTRMSFFFNKTRPSFTFKNYKNEIYFEWKSNPYSSLAGTLVDLTIQCLSVNNKFREFSFHFKIKGVVYETITGRYHFIQLKNKSLNVEEPNVPVLDLSNGFHDSICSKQIDAPLKINKSNAVCIILWEESTLMRNRSSSMNLGNMIGLFSLNDVNKSLRLQWKPTSDSLLNNTIFNLTILCYDDHNENQTIAEKSYLIFQTISNPDEKKPTSKESDDLLLEIILPVTFSFILLVVLLAVFSCCYRRRRRRRQPELSTNEEMQSREVHEDPSQMYEPLRKERQVTDVENPYQGLVGLDAKEIQSNEVENSQRIFNEDPSQMYQGVVGLDAQKMQSREVHEDPSQMYEPLRKERQVTDVENPYQGLVGLDAKEMQSREVQEDPSQTYEPLRKERQVTDVENPYQGLVGLDAQGVSVYDDVAEKGTTNPGADDGGEYSYASIDNLPR